MNKICHTQSTTRSKKFVISCYQLVQLVAQLFEEGCWNKIQNMHIFRKIYKFDYIKYILFA